MSPLKSSWCALAGIALMSKRKIGSLLGRTAFFFCTPHETIENWLPVGLQHFTRPEKGEQAHLGTPSAYLQMFPLSLDPHFVFGRNWRLEVFRQQRTRQGYQLFSQRSLQHIDQPHMGSPPAGW